MLMQDTIKKLGLGTQENFKEEIIKRLIKDFRGID